MNYYTFRAEITDPKNGKTRLTTVHVRSKSLSGAMRKVHQDYNGINVISIIN